MLDDEEDFKWRVRKASDDALMQAYNDAMTGAARWALAPWQVHIIDEELTRRRRRRMMEEAEEADTRVIKDLIKRSEQKAKTKTTTKKPTKKLKKEKTTMATETNNIKVNTKIDINAIIQAKFVEKLFDETEDKK